MSIIDGLKYSDEHVWVKVDGDNAIIGVTDFAQSSLGEIVFIDFPKVGDSITAGESFGTLESAKTTSDIIAPVSGTVVEANDDLGDAPEKINEDPYGSTIIVVKMSDAGQLDGLLDAEGYGKLLSELE